jgi:predicted  nucleic acid-binding Zn-ribbon protein
MVARMRLAVERIAAEYGNPTFAQVFTNDAVQAQAFRKRVQLLHRAEAINAEIAELEKQKLVAKDELDTVRQELAALQEQADALTNRLTRARTMLGMTSN